MAEKENEGRREFLAGRRMYYVSAGILEAALYGVPISFFCNLAAAQLGQIPTLALGLVVWALVAVWVVRRADAKFSRGRATRTPTGDSDRSARDSQTSIMKYAAVASLVLFAFAVSPLLISRLFPGAGVWVPLSGVGFFSFIILLGFTALYSLVGAFTAARSRYPEYPGFVAASLFALAVVAFFVTYILSG